DNNAEVLFGHVIDSSKFATHGLGDAEVAETNKQGIQNALARYLNRAAQDDCVPSVDIQVRVGPIGDTLINDLIKPFNPELVICGVRGLSSLKYAFVGSVSTHLIHNADCDVLVVRADAIEDVDMNEYYALGIEQQD
ncbi:MAG TPA: hypothetical protein DCP91_01410, partial [Eggerthellaceae bacterium]|nr:hypothetical protein [Eggerthellaceae bacterium]